MSAGFRVRSSSISNKGGDGVLSGDVVLWGCEFPFAVGLYRGFLGYNGRLDDAEVRLLVANDRI